MKNYKFQFYVGKEHLTPLARKFHATVYIDVSYEAGSFGLSVFYYGCCKSVHQNIIWTEELYQEIQDAAENNYQSQPEAREAVTA